MMPWVGMRLQLRGGELIPRRALGTQLLSACQQDGARGGFSLYMGSLCSALLPSSTHGCCVRAARAEQAEPAAQTGPFCSTKAVFPVSTSTSNGNGALNNHLCWKQHGKGKKIQAKLICRLANTASTLGTGGMGKTSPWEDKIPPAVRGVSSEPWGAHGGRDGHPQMGAEVTRRGMATTSSTARQSREAAYTKLRQFFIEKKCGIFELSVS